MNSNVVVHGEAPAARSAIDVKPARIVEPDGARRKDWPLALSFYVAVLVSYGGVGYVAYAIARTLL